MRVETSPGPDEATQHRSSHYVYDVRSGIIVAAYHFVGAAPKSEDDRLEEVRKSAHEVSGIPLEQLAVLNNPDVPPEAEIRVDHAVKRLVRVSERLDPRIRP